MLDTITAIFYWILNEENQLWLMFVSSFLSATLLPGNSEIVFSGYVFQLLQEQENYRLYWLFMIATFGNSLGSFSTYAIARFIPSPKFAQTQTKSVQWALNFTQKYGIWVLLFSWLPVVGDLFCGLAGWLRFNLWQSILLITMGKAVRYAMILWSLYTVFG